MKLKRTVLLGLAATLLAASCSNSKERNVDVLIIGGGASGTAAAVHSARLGVETLLVEETEWLGGMLTSAGVSAIDGNNKLPSGIWGEFRDSLVAHYGSRKALATGWVSDVLFEPSVGNAIFQNMLKREEKASVLFRTTLRSAVRQGGFWHVELDAPEGLVKLRAKVMIDATELGDVAKLCGVKYDIGMEDKNITGEPAAAEGAYDIIQDLTYVAILKDYHRDVTIPRPADYDSTLFLCSCVNPLCVTPKHPHRMWSKEMMITYGKLPNDKYMINWPMEGNDYYLDIIEMTPTEREEALKAAKSITMGFLYFMQTQLGFNTLGLADDEYPTGDLLPFIPYHRESRRIHGLVRFTENHMLQPYTQLEKLYRTAVAVGDYPVDHHHGRYTGDVKLPDLHFHPIPSFGLPLGTLIPQGVEGLIVAEKSISVSNIANGATRLQPVVLQIGQVAGTLAAQAVKGNVAVDKFPVRDIQSVLLENGAYLLPYLDVPKGHAAFLPLQRVGVTGIMKGVGKNVDWANETWFRANDLLKMNDLTGLGDFYSGINIDPADEREMTVGEFAEFLRGIAQKEAPKQDFDKLAQAAFKNIDKAWTADAKISRLEAAVLIDAVLNPFDAKGVDIKGNFIQK